MKLNEMMKHFKLSTLILLLTEIYVMKENAVLLANKETNKQLNQ